MDGHACVDGEYSGGDLRDYGPTSASLSRAQLAMSRPQTHVYYRQSARQQPACQRGTRLVSRVCVCVCVCVEGRDGGQWAGRSEWISGTGSVNEKADHAGMWPLWGKEVRCYPVSGLELNS